jgi:RND family efflux transporter MFP subunit
LTLAAALLVVSTTAAADIFTALPSERTVALTGYTRARATMELVSENPGRVLDVCGDVGDVIGKNGIFANLDPTFTALDLENNRVDQQRLTEIIKYNEKEARRYRELVKSETAAQSKLDELEYLLATSQRELDALKVQERIYMERLSRFRVKAPAGWTIVERHVEPGEWVAEGQVIGRAGDFTTLVVPFALAPEEYARLNERKGSLTLNLPDSNETVPARIYRIDPEFDAETRKIGVELALGNGKRLTEIEHYRGGIRVRLELNVTDASGSVIVPKQAVKLRYEEHWLTREDGSGVRVVVLGPGPNGFSDMLRVSSPEVSPGEIFILDAE